MTKKKKAKKKVRKQGQPTKYEKKYDAMLILHLSKGFSYNIFAAEVKVHVDTLYEWEKNNPSFSDAKREGLLLSQRFWESLAIKALLKNERFNTAAWIFCMKNKFGWRDKQPDEETKDKFEPIIIELPNVGKTLQIENKKGKE